MSELEQGADTSLEMEDTSSDVIDSPEEPAEVSNEVPEDIISDDAEDSF